MNRGHIYHVDLNPTQGREQAGGNFARHAGFAVSLSGAGTRTVGVILCNQARVIDLQARQARFIEKAPSFIVDEVPLGSAR